MDAQLHRFSDLNLLTEKVHALFESWEQQQSSEDEAAVRTFYLLKLATHEWIANLVQHADFSHRPPEVRLQVEKKEDGLRCIIEDNSHGFDLEGYLNTAPLTLERFPDRGSGLLILRACTHELSYTQYTSGENRLSFIVSADQDPWLSIQF